MLTQIVSLLTPKSIKVNGRRILLFRHMVSGEYHAMDAACYHRGAPLDEGDIEMLGDKLVVVCPLHKRPLSLSLIHCNCI